MWRLCLDACLIIFACGSVHAIIGQPANISEVPYQVSVQRGSYHVCGGVILNTTIVLTSAHCIDTYNAKYYYIQYGITSRNIDTNFIHVANAIAHPEYKDKLNDIALIFLKSPIKMGLEAQPAKLPTVAPSLKIECTISGWGQTQNNEAPYLLHKATIQVIGNWECEKALEHYAIGELLESRICAGSDEADSCDGDSGGPLYSSYGELIGLIDGGNKCGGDHIMPGVYVNVFYYLNWIKNTIDKYVQ